MSRIYRALLVVLAFEMGALLLYLPWSGYWEQNYFLSHYPSLLRFAAHHAAKRRMKHEAPERRIVTEKIILLPIAGPRQIEEHCAHFERKNDQECTIDPVHG